MTDASEKYRGYCRPYLGKLLQILRLDKVYQRAEGDYLFYQDDSGNEVKVADFLGGFGASLFGHNHPEIVKTALSNLKNNLPFNAQASCRSQAALLGEKLNDLMYKRTQQNYITTLANSGAEAVEAAIKHAEFSAKKKIERVQERLRKKYVLIKRNKNINSFFPSPDIPFLPQGKLTAAKLNSFFTSLDEYNNKIFLETPCFICLKRGFHGKTSGAVKLTYNKDYREPFSRIGLKTIFVDPYNREEIQEVIEKTSVYYYWPELNEKNEIELIKRKHVNISGFFVEPIQGEGGINILPKDMLEFYRHVATEHEIPLIFDEIQCGMGRTGTFTYSEQTGVAADYYLFSKSLGGGLSKISALLIKDTLYEEEFGFIHTSTFAEDDHSSALALTALNLLEKDNSIYQNCSARGKQLIDGLKEIKREFPTVIDDIRGAGLMIGIQFHHQQDSGSVILQLMSEQNMLGYVIAGYLLHEHCLRVAPTLSNNTTIRLEPSAYITVEACNQLLKAIQRLCEVIYKQNLYELLRFIVKADRQGDTTPVKNYYKKFSQENTEKEIKKVAFIGHFIESKHMLLFDESFTGFSATEFDELFNKFYEIVEPKISDEIIVTSPTGEQVQFCFIGLLIDSKIIENHMKMRNIKIIKNKIDKAVDLSIEKRCQWIGFGGYTSIVTKNCLDIITDKAAITTGNSLTIAMGIEALLKTAHSKGIELSKTCFAAVGANGNIASTYAEIMAEKVPYLVLIGRPNKEKVLLSLVGKICRNAFHEIKDHYSGKKKKLTGVSTILQDTETVRRLLQQNSVLEESDTSFLQGLIEEMKESFPIVWTSNYDHLKKAHLILGASNSATPVIFPAMIGEGPIVICDIAVPADVHESVRKECKNVTVIQGGIVKLPLNSNLTIKGLPLDKGELFACMSETALLGLDNVNKNFSYGSISKEQVKEIMSIAKKHGFELGRCKTERSY